MRLPVNLAARKARHAFDIYILIDRSYSWEDIGGRFIFKDGDPDWITAEQGYAPSGQWGSNRFRPGFHTSAT